MEEAKRIYEEVVALEEQYGYEFSGEMTGREHAGMVPVGKIVWNFYYILIIPVGITSVSHNTTTYYEKYDSNLIIV